MENKYTFQDFKTKISIMQVAIELGYKYDARDGKTQPAFVKHDINGIEIDKIYIKNPQNNSIQGYWRRSLTGKNSSGDLIGFVRENLSLFPESHGTRNEIDALNKVLGKLAGVAMQPEYIMKTFVDKYKNWENKPFILDRYERETDNVNSEMKFFSQRGISREMAELFTKAGAIELIKDKESKWNFKNLGFPYRVPGKEEIVGYEVRGLKGFKGKAEGTDSTNASWTAYIGDKRKYAPTAIKQVHFAESAYDIMAFVQLNKSRINLDNSIFVSTGGTFSEKQMQNLFAHYSNAIPVLHFDNDLNGIIYDCRTAALMDGVSLKAAAHNDIVNFQYGERAFSIPIDNLSFDEFKKKGGIKADVIIQKAPVQMKDWNDVIMPVTEPQKEEKKQDRYAKKKENEEKVEDEQQGKGLTR